MWAMTNAYIVPQAARQACPRSLLPTVIWANNWTDVSHLGCRFTHRFTLGANKALAIRWQRPKIRDLGLHWFRHGFGRVAGHVEVLIPRKSSEKKLTANDERFALAA